MNLPGAGQAGSNGLFCIHTKGQRTSAASVGNVLRSLEESRVALVTHLNTVTLNNIQNSDRIVDLHDHKINEKEQKLSFLTN